MNISIVGTGIVSTLGLGNQCFDFSKGISQPCIRSCQVKYQQDIHSQKIFSVPDFQSHPLIAQRGIKFLTRGTQQLFIASQEAIEYIHHNQLDSKDLGIVIGTNYASLEVISNYDWITISQGPSFVSVMDIPNTLLNAPASQIAIKHNAKAFNSTVSTGRCASLDAIGYAAFFLQENRGKRAIAGGIEELNPNVLWQLNSKWKQTDHMVPFGEAAAVVLLEANQQTPSLAQLVGWANYWSPHDSLKEIVREAIQNALSQAGMSAKDLGIIAMGVSSSKDQDLIDGVESVISQKNESTQKIKTFSLNPLVGETESASGAMHLVATILAYKSQKLPPTMPIENIIWKECFEISSKILSVTPAPALIVEMDPSGGVSALVITPPSKK